MSQEILHSLNELGYSPSEAMVYISALQLGPTTVAELNKRSGLSRTAVYEAISSLQNQGVLTVLEKEGKRFLRVLPPNQLLSVLEDRSTQKFLRFRGVIPALEEMGRAQHPIVQITEGIQAMFAAFREVAREAPKEVLSLANANEVYDRVCRNTVIEARKVVPIEQMTIRVLHTGAFGEGNVLEKLQRQLPHGALPVKGDVWIYNDTTVFLSYSKKMSVITIKHPEFTHNIRLLFEEVWKHIELQNQMNCLVETSPPSV